MSYKQMPVVVAAHDVFKFCRHELKQLSGIRLGLVTVKHREGNRRGKLSSQTDEYIAGQRAPTTSVELLGGLAPKAMQPARRPPALIQQRRGMLLSHTDEDRIRRVNALIDAGEATAGYFVEVFTSIEERWFMQVTGTEITNQNLRARYCKANSLNRDPTQQESDCPLGNVKDYGDRGIFINL